MNATSQPRGYDRYRAADGRWRPPRPEGVARVLAKAGYGARPRTEALVRSGRVTIAGVVIDDPGHPITRGDEVELDGQPLVEAPRRFLMLNKPAGYDCQLGRSDLRSITRLLPPEMVGLELAGRLDARASGLVLVSNHLAWNTHVAETDALERRYEVSVQGDVTPILLDVLRAGIALPGAGHFKPDAIDVIAETGATRRLLVVLRGVHARKIRAAFASVRCEVVGMVRIGYGPLTLGDLERGRWCALTPNQYEPLAPPEERGRAT